MQLKSMDNEKPAMKFLRAFTYTQNFEKVYKLVRNVEKCEIINNSVIKDVTTDYNITKMTKSWEVGAEFNLLWKKVVRLFFRTISYEEGRDYVIIRWNVYKTEPKTVSYSLTYSIYNDPYQGLCTLVIEWDYTQRLPFSPCNDEESNKDTFLIYTNYETYLNKNGFNFCQEEKVEIKLELGKVWRIVKDLKILSKNIPLICDKVNYEGEISEGTALELVWETKKSKKSANLIVKSITLSEDECSIIYKSVKVLFPAPRQKIIWKVVKTQNNNCNVCFSHLYKEKINESALNSLSKSKKEILAVLKDKLESNTILE